MTPEEAQAVLAHERAPAQAQADAWNAAHAVGMQVLMKTITFEGMGITTSEAYVLSGPPGHGHPDWKTQPAAVVDVEAPPGVPRGWVKLSALGVLAVAAPEPSPIELRGIPRLEISWPPCSALQNGKPCEEEAGVPDICRWCGGKA